MSKLYKKVIVCNSLPESWYNGSKTALKFQLLLYFVITPSKTNTNMDFGVCVHRGLKLNGAIGDFAEPL